MCTAPLKIRNNAKVGTDNTSSFRYVPCGHCESCLAKYRNEWYLRSYYHYKYYTEVLGGCCTFITLTYNNQFLPNYFDTYTNNGKRYVINAPVFNKWHIQRFIKYVRRNAIKTLKYGVEKANLITSLITCEYGSKTLRPHYHGLMYFPTQVPEYLLKKVLIDSWCTKLTTRVKSGETNTQFQLGFISFGKYGCFVTDYRALKYCMKYVTKDMGLFEQNHKYHILEYIQTKDRYDKIKAYLPFHLQSRGYGAYGAQLLTDIDIINGFVYDPETSSGKEKTLPIPTYILGKIFYQPCQITNNNIIGLHCHTDRFYSTLKARINRQINTSANHLSELLYNYDTFSGVLKGSAPALTTQYKYKTLSLHSAYDKITSTINNRFYDFCAYRLLKNYASTYLDIDYTTDLLEVLHFLYEQGYKAKDHAFNTKDFSEVLPDYESKFFLELKRSTSYLHYENPLYATFQLFPEATSGYYAHEYMLDNKAEINYYNVPDIIVPVQVNKFIPKLVTVPIPGTERLRANKTKFVDSLSTKSPQATADSWESFPRFNGFGEVDELLSVLENTAKDLCYQKAVAEHKKQKETSDYFNYLKYE